MSAITTELLQTITTKQLGDAKVICCIAVDKFKTDNAEKKAVLKGNINSCDTIDHLLKIMWNAYLSGEGLPVYGSNYQYKFGDSKIVLGTTKGRSVKRQRSKRFRAN